VDRLAASGGSVSQYMNLGKIGGALIVAPSVHINSSHS